MASNKASGLPDDLVDVTPNVDLPDDLEDVEAEELAGDDVASSTANDAQNGTRKVRTFYVRDVKGNYLPISYEEAVRADAAGLKVLSEGEVRALSDEAAKAVAPAKPPTPPKDPGLGTAILHSLGQGFFKQGYDELTGAIGRARGDTVGNGLRMPDGSVRHMATSGDAYRAARDREREIERGAREHWAPVSFVSNMAGDIASDVALSYMGIPVSSTPYQVASGALSGFLGSDAELSTDNVEGRNVASAAGSTALGAGLGYVLPKVGNQIARALPGAMASLREGLENRALDKVRKVLTSGSGQLARRRPVSAEAAREALDSGAIPIWGTTQGAFERLRELAEFRGRTYAEILDELQAAGVQGPEVEALARRLAREGADRRANTSANKNIAEVFEGEAENIRNVAPRERVPVVAPTANGATAASPVMAERTASNLPLSQAERIKRDLQDKAFYDRIQKTGLDEAKEEVAAMYREAIEDAVAQAGQAAPPGSAVADLAERFVPVKRQLGRTIEARNAAERGAGAAAHRVGGAAGVNLFDVANAANATGTKGLPALLLAGAGRIWKERGPSTLANVYDVGAEATGNISRAAYANPDITRELARAFTGPFGRQIAASTAAENLFTPEDDKGARMQRALADYLLRRSAEGAQ